MKFVQGFFNALLVEAAAVLIIYVIWQAVRHYA